MSATDRRLLRCRCRQGRRRPPDVPPSYANRGPCAMRSRPVVAVRCGARGRFAVRLGGIPQVKGSAGLCSAAVPASRSRIPRIDVPHAATGSRRVARVDRMWMSLSRGPTVYLQGQVSREILARPITWRPSAGDNDLVNHSFRSVPLSPIPTYSSLPPFYLLPLLSQYSPFLTLPAREKRRRVIGRPFGVAATELLSGRRGPGRSAQIRGSGAAGN